MFLWIGKKEFMRGSVWFLFFLGSIAVLIGGILMICTGTKPDSLAAMIIFSVLAVIYIVAYIIAPKKSQPLFVKNAQTETQPVEIKALAVPATLKIIRDSSAVAVLMPTIIFLNGVQVATIANGGSAQIQTNTSHNVLQTNSVGSKNVRYELDVQSGVYAEIHVKGGVFLPKLTILNTAGK